MLRLSFVITAFLLTNVAFAGKQLSVEDASVAEHRDKKNIERNQFRKPVATLGFFGLKPNMTVVEIWPGGGLWYTEILAPYLKQEGKLYIANFNPEAEASYVKKAIAKIDKTFKANPAVYGKVEATVFDPPKFTAIAPAGTADMVLTFRNAHNWYMRGGGEEKLLAAFQAFHKALKPGGVLGLVDHRLPEKRPDTDQNSSGYIKQSVVIKVAQKAGFKLDKTSEINANPKDKANYDRGVWTLPPSLALGEKDKSKYLQIGESDRMTLRFVKP